MVRAELAQVEAVVEFERGSPQEACRILIDGSGLLVARDPARSLLMLAEAIRCAWHVADLGLLRKAEKAMLAAPLPTNSPLAALPPALSAFAAGLPAGPATEGGLLYALAEATRPAPPAERLMACSIGLATGASCAGLESAVRFVSACRRQGETGRLPYALQLLAYALLKRGRFREAAEAALEGLELATAAGQLHRASQLNCVLGWLAAIEGDEERCTAFVLAGTEYAAAQGIAPTLVLGGWAMALLDLGHNRNEEALDRLEGLAFSDSTIATIQRAPDQVEAAVRCGRRARAAAPLELLEEWAAHSGHALAGAVALRCRALVSPAREAGCYFVEALRVHATTEQPYAQARTALVYGEWLRRTRRRAGARPYLSAAAEAFDRLGAHIWAARARAELAATGVEAGPRPPAPEALGRLTPQQVQIVRLAATGATNREIAARLHLSPRTVGNHLDRAYPKLGISSRVELSLLDLGD